MNVIQAHIHIGDASWAECATSDIYISSCGHFMDIDRDTHTNRTNGRRDYQIIFVTSGCVYVHNPDGTTTAAKEGSIIVYQPGVPQKYGCKAADLSSYYWIHFGGKGADSFLQSVGLYDRLCYHNMDFIENMSDIYNIVSEIRLKRVNYKIQCALIFCNMLNHICRSNCNDSVSDGELMRLMPALNAMEHSMQIAYSISDYAKMCGVSSYHFMHVFKKYIGESPIKYKNRLSMERARYLVAHSNMTISEIAEAVGFSDSLYFSKKFRSVYGVSPAKYRKK